MKLFTNGTFITLDPENPEVRGLVVDQGVVLDVGSAEDLRNHYPGAEVVDLEGKTVVPGFNDNHIHLNQTGTFGSRPILAGQSEGEIIETLKSEASGRHSKGPLLAWNWDYPAVSEPHRSVLDEHFPHRPVVLYQYGGHGTWVNSAALKKMRIDASTPDPPEGQIVRDSSGEPTGLLRDMNQNPWLRGLFVRQYFDMPGMLGAYAEASRLMAEAGITSAQDNTWSFRAQQAIRRVQRRGTAPKVRVSCWTYGAAPVFSRFMELLPYHKGAAQLGPVKFFLDGTFTTRTAWLMEGYADEPTNTGNGVPKDEIVPILRSLARRRRQGAFHAIGDRAVKEFLDAVEEVAREYPVIRTLRMRLEHAQLIRPEDGPRLKDLGVLIAAQPAAVNNLEKDIKLLGLSRTDKAYSFRSLIDAGVHVSFGSDYPGEDTYAPLQGIHNVVNRPGNEAISPEDALRAYAVESAYAEFEEDRKGMLKKGFYADFALLSDDLRTVAPGHIKDLRVERTYVGGEETYRR